MRINYSKTRTKDKNCIVIYSKDKKSFWLGHLVSVEHYVGFLIKKEQNIRQYAEFVIFDSINYNLIEKFYISQKDFNFLENVIHSWNAANKLLVYLEEE